jgi:AraC-like DNA-binding protein
MPAAATAAVPSRPAPRHLDLATHDIDPLCDAVTQLFGHHVVLACGPAAGGRRLVARPVADVLIGTLQYGSSFACVADQPRSQLVFTVPQRSAGLMGRQPYGPGDVMAFNPDWVGRLELTAPGVYANTCFGPEQLHAGLRALLGTEPDRLPVFADHMAADSPVARHAAQVLQLLHEAATLAGACTPVVQRMRESWAVMELLSIWPHSASAALLAPARPPAPRAMRRALDYIDAHLDQPLSVVDIARAASLGVRALNDAFRRQLGTTPARHVRALRLDAARLELVSDAAASVTSVAMRWQFSNPGLFARYFRQRFGCLPGALRRSHG